MKNIFLFYGNEELMIKNKIDKKINPKLIFFIIATP